MTKLKIGNKAHTIDDPEHIGTIVMLVSNKVLIRWHKGYKTWHMVEDVVLVEQEQCY